MRGNLFLISLSRKQRLSHDIPASFLHSMASPIQSLIQFLANSVSISAMCSVDLSEYNYILLTVKTGFVTGATF